MRRILVFLVLIAAYCGVTANAALTDVGYIPLASPGPEPTGLYVTSLDMDNANEAIALVFIAPKTGSITKVGFNITTIDGAEPNYIIAIEGKAAGSKEPDGTPVGGGSPASVTTDSFVTDWQWKTLDNAASVTAGSEYTATIRYASGTIGASNAITVEMARTAMALNWGAPYCTAADASGVWDSTPASQIPIISVQYSDGQVLDSTCPYTTSSNAVWSTSGSPADLYRGTKWTPVFGCRVVGVFFTARIRDTADFKVHLFTGTTSTASTTFDPGEMGSGSNLVKLFFIPLTPTTLTADTAYRFVIEPINAVSQTTLTSTVFLDTDCRYAFYGDLQGTVSSDATPTGWTDSTTTIWPVIPVIDQIDISAGGGGGTVIGGGVVK